MDLRNPLAFQPGSIPLCMTRKEQCWTLAYAPNGTVENSVIKRVSRLTLILSSWLTSIFCAFRSGNIQSHLKDKVVQSMIICHYIFGYFIIKNSFIFLDFLHHSAKKRYSKLTLIFRYSKITSQSFQTQVWSAFLHRTNSNNICITIKIKRKAPTLSFLTRQIELLIIFYN